MHVVTDPSWTFKYLPNALYELNITPRGVIHVGAHWGEEGATYVHCGFSTIVLVEPDPISVARIREESWASANGVTVLQTAITSVEGQARFYRIPGSVWSGLKPAVGHEPPSAEFDVDTIRIDTLQHQYEANVLVVDTQGTELDALSSADLDMLDLVIVETQESGIDGAHPAELAAYAQSKGWYPAIIWDRTGGWTDTLLVPQSTH